MGCSAAKRAEPRRWVCRKRFVRKGDVCIGRETLRAWLALECGHPVAASWSWLATSSSSPGESPGVMSSG